MRLWGQRPREMHIGKLGYPLYAKNQQHRSQTEVNITSRGVYHCLPMQHATAEPHIMEGNSITGIHQLVPSTASPEPLSC